MSMNLVCSQRLCRRSFLVALVLANLLYLLVPTHPVEIIPQDGDGPSSTMALPMAPEKLSEDAKPQVAPKESSRAGPTVLAVQWRCDHSKPQKACFPQERCRLSAAKILDKILDGATKCPQDAWAVKMVRADPDPDKVILNVGCNKGHDAIAWLQRFDQQGFWDLKKWTGLMSKYKSVCKQDVRIKSPPKVDSTKAPRALCVEAIPTTVQLLKDMRKQAGYEVEAAGWLKFWWLAITDVARPGDTVEFLTTQAGGESARMGMPASFQPDRLRIQVPLATVDGLIHNLSLPKVDILIVDTEGADPAVLRGAEKTLKTVRYLLFETHRDLKGTAWSEETIFSVVSRLSIQGFDCYWAGNNGKLSSITWCYEESFEKLGWGNIACVKRGDVWWEVMEGFDPNTPAGKMHAGRRRH